MPTQIDEEFLHGITNYSPEVPIDLDDIDFLSHLFTFSSETMKTIFDNNPPKFLLEAFNAARTRFKLDCDIPISATELSSLAGVNRKTIVNAKLAEKPDSISPKKAIGFLNGKARNRWTEDDEEGDPIGLKLLHTFPELGMKENFYPSVRKFKNLVD